MSVFTNEELLAIAKNQKKFLGTLLVILGVAAAGILAFMAGMTTVFGILMLCYVITSIAQLVYTYKLVSSMKKSPIVTLLLIVVFSFIFPLISVLVMFNQSSKASLILKDAGYKIGLLGADVNALAAACASGVKTG